MTRRAVRVIDRASGWYGAVGFVELTDYSGLLGVSVELTDYLGPRVALNNGRQWLHVWFASSQVQHGTLDGSTFTPTPHQVPRGGDQ